MELPERYPKNHYDKKASRYARTVRALFGVSIDAITTQRWSDVIRFGRAIDTFLDDGESDGLLQRTAQIGTFLEHPQEIASQFPSLSPLELGEDRYARLFELGQSILSLNLDIKTTSSINRYARLRRLEGRQYSHLITDIVTPYVADQPNYSKFAHWLIKAGEVTTVGNSLLDIHDDYRRGEIALVPNHMSRAILLGHMSLALVQPVQNLELASGSAI